MAYIPTMPPFKESKESNGGSPISGIPVPAVPAVPADTDYHYCVEAALYAICRPDYQPGMILWLETVDPSLYDRLTRILPDLISRLWNERAPLDKFHRVVNEWLATHRRACTLFKSQER
jgi:hypothetical protein